MDVFSAIVGGILGAGFGLWQGYEQKRQMKKQQALAEKQFALQKQQFENEQQQYAKANQKEVDIEGLLTENSGAMLSETQLTGARGLTRKNNPLNKRNKLLGGS